ncbi:hypothetical protein [Mangrovimonas sp. TPBH4]|uniref:hypothetical protein n=1 Tax=Mangrovimonas sp. TPBH4 TaxID=1645914 RepID=UPI0006B42968|nr:hypothetical protein [Mangrovimonas sp. TPBH4]
MKATVFAIVVIFLLVSCSSSDDSSPSPEDFYALKEGNSWVYKNYKYNTTSQAYEDTGIIDSVSIVGTKHIYGDSYFEFRTKTTGNDAEITYCNPNGEHFEYLRAYKGSLIDQDNSIKFVNNNFDEILVRELEGFGSYYIRVDENPVLVDVESGSFECLKMEYYLKYDEDETMYKGKVNYYYAEGIGLVKDTPSHVALDIPAIERRLVSYHLE